MLPYGRQWIDEDDIASVVQVLRSDRVTQGPKIAEFEGGVARYCGASFGVAMSSGTTALHAACAVAGIDENCEAITTPITFAATVNSVVYCGSTPVFADIQVGDHNIDPAEVERRVSARTKAIIPVDFAGHPADMDEVMRIAKSNGLVVIEDACHALGAKYKGRPVGSLADMTVLSFHPIKHITTGEGGMVLTESEDYYERLIAFRHHGITRDTDRGEPWFYEIRELGHNFRITDIQCALGLSQLKKLDRFVRRRREIAEQYNAAFADTPEVITPVEDGEVVAAYHLYVICLDLGLLKTGRRELFEALRAENIGVNVHYVPAHLHPFYQLRFGYRKGSLPRAEEYYERAITLPLFPKMADEDVDHVIRAVKKVISHYRN
jgi:UDP-4-amino-4,6-dideoxy-N-acetyl-beta-L-altrosamine transaminase